MSILPLRNFSSQSSKNPPGSADSQSGSGQLPSSKTRGSAEVRSPGVPAASPGQSGAGITSFLQKDFLFSFMLSLFFPFSRNYWLLFFFFKIKLENKTTVSGPVAIQPWQRTEKPRWRRGKLSTLHNSVWHLFVARKKVVSLCLILPTPPLRFSSQALSAWSCFPSTHLLANLDGCHIITRGQNSRASNGDNKLNLVWEISVFFLSCRINFTSH